MRRLADTRAVQARRTTLMAGSRPGEPLSLTGSRPRCRDGPTRPVRPVATQPARSAPCTRCVQTRLGFECPTRGRSGPPVRGGTLGFARAPGFACRHCRDLAHRPSIPHGVTSLGRVDPGLDWRPRHPPRAARPCRPGLRHRRVGPDDRLHYGWQRGQSLAEAGLGRRRRFRDLGASGPRLPGCQNLASDHLPRLSTGEVSAVFKIGHPPGLDRRRRRGAGASPPGELILTPPGAPVDRDSSSDCGTRRPRANFNIRNPATTGDHRCVPPH